RSSDLARVVVRGRLKNISNKKNTSILGDSMEKYRELIRKLEQNGVCFAEGLSDKELFDIQYEYNVNFPKSLKVFYKAGLPISDEIGRASCRERVLITV